MPLIKGKQLHNQLRSASNPFQAIYSDDFVGDLNGAVRFEAKNETGAVLTKGQVVYISGVSGTVPTVGLADANDASKMPAFGLVYASVNNNAAVEIVTFGNLTDINTSSYSVGDTLYVSTTPGALTATAPTGSSSLLQNIGKVVKDHSSAGIIKVGGAGRTAATPNLDQGRFFLGNASNQSAQSAYTLPIADGTANQVLTTDGSGAVTFQDAGGGGSVALDGIGAGTGNATLATNGNITIDAQLSNSDIIFKGTDGGADTTFVTIDGSDGGTIKANGDLRLEHDSARIYFGADSEVHLAHKHDIGLTLDMGSPGSGEPKFTITSTNSSSSGPSIILDHNPSSGTSGQLVSEIVTNGIDSGGGTHTYSRIRNYSTTATAGSEAGGFKVFVAAGGTGAGFSGTEALTVEGDASGNRTVNVVEHDGSASGLELGGTLVTATAAELNFLDTSAKSPSANDVLTYNGSALEWAAASGGISNLSEDSSPQLGGNLDLNGNDIVTASNADLELAPNGTGIVVVKGNNNSGAIKLNCEFNSHGVTIQGPAHSANATYTLTLPVNDGDADQVLKTDGSGVLSWVDQSGGGGWAFASITSATTAQANYHYSVNTSGSAFTLTLPQISTVVSSNSETVQIRVKLATAGNDLTIARSGSDTIDGATSYTMNVSKSSITLVANLAATDWEII